ncbi:DNA-processing protein DprA [Vibrio sp. S4M6]|uniref:DNA-processing protein DprA n=1 Tax=Vibrio sinus TaxID=2946865 RepID=UPI00202A4995|nr:DNA-processing protein DprA [Vibrio sinus]MCL9783009.1 DNA-processing protein DprA [Vibrio sinus]
MDEAYLSAWMTLALAPKLGPKSLSQLSKLDKVEHIVGYDKAALASIGLSQQQIHYITSRAKRDIDQCFEWKAQSPDRHILVPNKSHYPSLLNQIDSPPPILFVKGEVEVLDLPQIAMVGSRNASAEALQTAYAFAKDFVEHGLVVTSGLALGIDGYAHDGALKNAGKTIAVLGSGLEQVYPSRHRGLSQRITEQGALVSEFLPHIKARSNHFPRRNRIISGLCTGVLVVEAAERSGSLITARYAAEQGRDVFAIPGSIHNPNNRGGNQLIKSGACLVQKTQDVLNEIEILVNWSINSNKSVQVATFVQNDGQEELPFSEVLANVGIEATPVDIVADRTNIPVHEVMMQLLELELSGHVVAVSGGYIRKGRGEL